MRASAVQSCSNTHEHKRRQAACLACMLGEEWLRPKATANVSARSGPLEAEQAWGAGHSLAHTWYTGSACHNAYTYSKSLLLHAHRANLAFLIAFLVLCYDGCSSGACTRLCSQAGDLRGQTAMFTDLLARGYNACSQFAERSAPDFLRHCSLARLLAWLPQLGTGIVAQQAVSSRSSPCLQ